MEHVQRSSLSVAQKFARRTLQLTEITTGHADMTASRTINSVKEPVRIRSSHAEALSALQIPHTTRKKEEPVATNASGTAIPVTESVARGISCAE